MRPLNADIPRRAASTISEAPRPAPIPIMAGFECSTFRRSDGVRIDIVDDTRHDQFAREDFGLIKSHGMKTAREGARWHLIEPIRGSRDWSSVDIIRLAGAEHGVEIIWDLLHFGLPDWINPFHPDFPAIFADFAADFAARVGPGGLYVPVNEISFTAWAGGDVEFLYPWSKGRGNDLKRALCDASIRAIRAIRSIDPASMIISVEPMIKVRERSGLDAPEARRMHVSQFEATDILTGRLAPELGGHLDLIDIVGVNHYPYSQWFTDRATIDWRSHLWTPLSQLLARVHARYAKPLLLAETGCEGDDRANWFDYVAAECDRAQANGVPVMGICLYPILSHTAWTGERFCPNGLYDGSTAERTVHEPLLAAMNHYQNIAAQV